MDAVSPIHHPRSTTSSKLGWSSERDVAPGARLRVLHISKDRHPRDGGGGIARHIDGLLRALAGTGVAARNVTTAPAPAPLGPYEGASARGLGLVRHIRWADVVHLHQGRQPETAVAALLCLLFRKPFVYTPHAYYDGADWQPPEGERWKAIVHRLRLRGICEAIWDHTVERALLALSARPIMLSSSWVDYVARRGLPAARCAVVPNAVTAADLPIAARGSVAPLRGTPAILAVSRLDPVKCIDDAIRALGRPELAEAVLHVVGRGEDRERLEGIAERLGVAGRVIFHGFVADERVAEMAAAADVFVLPSRQEGLPTTIIEMLLRGLPVVCSDIPGNRAVMEAVGLDTMHPLHDAAAMASGIARVGGRPLDEATRREVARRFTWEANAPALLHIYEEAARSASPSMAGTARGMDAASPEWEWGT